MFVYEKKLQYPVRIANPNPQLAAVIISQYGGPDGELGASLRYLSQRYSMPYPELKGLLTDIGTEELGHLEMVGTIVHQLTRTLTQEQIESAGFANYFVDHTACRVQSARFCGLSLDFPVFIRNSLFIPAGLCYTENRPPQAVYRFAKERSI